jgi:hypothetical protein
MTRAHRSDRCTVVPRAPPGDRRFSQLALLALLVGAGAPISAQAPEAAVDALLAFCGTNPPPAVCESSGNCNSTEWEGSPQYGNSQRPRAGQCWSANASSLLNETGFCTRGAGYRNIRWAGVGCSTNTYQYQSVITDLNLRDLELLTLVPEIGQLTSLESLCAPVRPPSLPACLPAAIVLFGRVAELTARDLLRDRDVRNNRLTELPQEITQLTSLRQLCAPVHPPYRLAPAVAILL